MFGRVINSIVPEDRFRYHTHYVLVQPSFADATPARRVGVVVCGAILMDHREWNNPSTHVTERLRAPGGGGGDSVPGACQRRTQRT